MDTTASILTLIGTTISIADNLHRVFSGLKNAPSETISLLKEVQSIRKMLADIREKENVLTPWLEASALSIVLHRAYPELDECNQLMVSFISQNSKEELVFNQFGWYLKKDAAEKLHSRASETTLLPS